MSTTDREHTSITVSDPERAAKTLCELFGWRVCSDGPKVKDGQSICVGTEKTWITLSAAMTDDHVPAEKQTLASSGAFALNHVGIPARCPETLAAWYGGHFKLMVEGAFAYGDGWLIACEPGTPLTEMPAHFGFMLDNRAEVDRWKEHFEEQGIAVDVQRNGNAIFMTDPEGNSFEIFFDPTRFLAPT
jgi:catechol 2,3-dioxygenase-like lactoylglutathione lyase family enzyme|tara:strand:+ start:51448 stop:52011 length:564 start_codon:yes stop_codon:yes gene_type:complete